MPDAPRIDETALQLACDRLPMPAGRDALVEAMSEAIGRSLRPAFVDRDWYRPGGLIDSQGRRLTDDLEAWALEQCDGDVAALSARYGDADCFVTRLAGRTFYLTAPLGSGPLDFLQLEVDEVQEVLTGPLFGGGPVPDLLDDLISRVPHGQAQPLSPPRYQVRQMRVFSEVADDLTSDHRGDPRFRRFLAEWEQSSASRRGHFSDRWVLSVTPYQDAEGEHLLEARPVPTVAVAFPDLARRRTDEIDYHPARAAQGIDNQAGYPMAWYFMEVACHYAPYRCIVDIRDDFRAGSGEAGPTGADMRLVDNWVDEPYNFH